MEKKSKSLAEKYRIIGNSHFSKNEYFDALKFYNRSLCCAENGSESMSMAFANRSAVYMKLNHFDLCLENIQLARNNNYPQDKIEKLFKREQDCKELMKMKTLKPNPYDDPFNYFKLSYAPNPKYPQIVDCLELRKDSKGVHVVTTRDLKTGDIIGIEEPLNPSIFYGARLHRCNFCLKDQLMNLLPCSGCAMAMFCSEKCREEAMKGLHQYECNSEDITDFGFNSTVHLMVYCLRVFENNVAGLRKFLEANKKPVTVFDFDFSDPEDPMYKKNMLLVALSKVLGSKSRFESADAVVLIGISKFADDHKKFNQLYRKDSSLPKLIHTFFNIRLGFLLNIRHSKEINLYKHLTQTDSSDEIAGAAVYPLQKLLSQSCDPNINSLDVAGKSVSYVCKPIKKGSELSFAVLGIFSEDPPVAERKKLFKNILGSKCDCEACKKNWPTLSGLREVDPFFQYDDIREFPSHDEAKNIVAQNNAYVDKNFKEHKPTKEVYFTILSNHYKLQALARPSFYP